jgi:hypothetical protein
MINEYLPTDLFREIQNRNASISHQSRRQNNGSIIHSGGFFVNPDGSGHGARIGSGGSPNGHLSTIPSNEFESVGIAIEVNRC